MKEKIPLAGCYTFYDAKNGGNGIKCTARRQINRKTIYTKVYTSEMKKSEKEMGEYLSSKQEHPFFNKKKIK